MSRLEWDRAAVRRVSDAAADGLRDGAEHLETAANALVPDLTGALQASSQVDVDRTDRSATVSYSDEAAVYQHERLDFAHDDGQAKFLEQPLHTEQDEIVRRIARRVRRELD